MTRLQLYVAGSALLAHVVLLRAYYERPNFYSAAVYISQSTGSLLFLINLGLIITVSVEYGLQRLFYGPLRPIETEQLYDKAWFAVCETLLAMTMFRDDLGLWFLAMFLCLLGGKVWQWIGEGRVEFLEQQPPANPRLFHTRLMSSLLLSVFFDIFMMRYCIDSILQETRPGVMVMFGFEYVLLAIASISTLLRYTLSLVELLVIRRQETAMHEARRVARERARQEATEQAQEGDAAAEVAPEDDTDDDGEVPGWEEKGRWVFYLDLTTDFIKSVVYLGFFMILMAFYGLPLHIIRDLFITIRSFIKRVNDFVRYRNATQDMNARYTDATAEELAGDNTCIVCREEMRPWVPPGADAAQAGRRVDERQRSKKLPCGHILHFHCLRSWLERQQVCPTCRRSVLIAAPGQNNQQNNPGNQGQQNPPNGGIFNNPLFNPGNMGNQPQPLAGQQGPQVQQGGQNRPAPNMRVFTFGPIRIALGNLRIPADQHLLQGNANNMNNNNNGMANLAQQLAQVQNQGQNQNPNQPPNQALAQFPNLNLAGIPLAGPFVHNPADIQSDILRLQQNIFTSLRQLNAQHDQLEYVHALLGELHRLQQASGVTAANGQELPIIAPLNPPYGLSPMVPQAYLTNGPVLRQGDAALPEGLILPEGWTLRPLARTPQQINREVQTPISLNPENQTAPEAILQAHHGTSSVTPSQPQPRVSPPPPPATSTAPTSSGAAAGASAKPAEPSSLESSWSFGNAAGSNEGETTSSAVAGSSSEGQNVTRRTVTVEDADENGQ
ncbi:hypothetical protein BCR34DRAFT_477135 [Clohesyomyces aquaticus]|uniref:RING-type E3 ubiquitin transferase n=1 Tax=Clohesyomyces aquaticus TaxID=1231657 RepID=A0A1Y1ZZY6_9PLEO|nr:hypothetical protein BCR34DRAFT_477135 [Clohesyomyces aquaticus]